jgi:hypothetical protein
MEGMKVMEVMKVTEVTEVLCSLLHATLIRSP